MNGIASDSIREIRHKFRINAQPKFVKISVIRGRKELTKLEIYNNVESLTDDNGWQENKKGGILTF